MPAQSAPSASSAPVSSKTAQPGRTVLDPHDISRALTRIAHEILERNKGASDLVLLGVPSRGVPLAERIAAQIASVEGVDVPVGSLDVTMYRDDLRMRPARTLMPTDIPPGGIDGKTVVIVDDVLFSGRTIRAALDAMNDIGRPRVVRLAVLVDRGHRELPIRADFVGKNLPTSLVESVRVRVSEFDGADGVTIFGTPGAPPSGSTDTDPSGQTGAGERRRPGEAAPAERCRPDARGRHADPGDRRGAALAGRPPDQEAARAARPHGGEPVLRGQHPHPDLLRGSRQAALGRRHQLLREGLQPQQGREPQGHVADPGGDGRRRGRRTPLGLRCAAPARQRRLVEEQRGERRGRHPRAPDAGAARRVHHVAAPRQPRRPTGRHRRRRAAQPGCPVQRAAAEDARRRGHPDRPTDAAAGRRRGLGRRDLRTTSTPCCRRPTW